MTKVEMLKADTKIFLDRMKDLETMFVLLPKNKIKKELGMEEYERIGAILEYVNIRTTEIANSLKEDLTIDLFEEQNSFFFILKEENKLKKQAEANENIDEILEVAEVFGVDIERDTVVTMTEAREAQETISTNKVLAKARKQLNAQDYINLRDKFVENGWIKVEEVRGIKLEEEALLTQREEIDRSKEGLEITKEGLNIAVERFNKECGAVR